jgi:hypothetical protein
MRRAPGLLPLLSFIGLLLEITLTRLLAYAFPYHLAALVISAALLGLGLGGFAASLRPAWKTQALLALLALSLPLPYAALLATARGGLLGACALAPFFLCGAALARQYAELGAARSYRAYFLDLGGGALACAAAVPLLDLLGAPAICLLLCALALAALAARAPGRARAAAAAGALAAAGLCGALASGRLDDGLPRARAAADKPLAAALRQGGAVEAFRWSAVGRADLYGDPAFKNVRWIYNDGVNPTILARRPETPAQKSFLKSLFVALPLAAKPASRALVLGSGGGLEVQLAGLFGVGRVDAVEVNPATIALVRAARDFAGPVYDQPGVDLTVGEARRFLAGSRDRYDLIQLSLVFTATVEAGTYAFVEGYLYTKEAHRLLLGRLAPDGLLAIVDDAPERQARQLFTALAVLEERGLSTAEAMRHVAVLYSPPAKGMAYNHLLLVSPSPLPPALCARLVRLSREGGFTPEWVPGAAAARPYDLIAARGEAAFMAAQPLDYAPTTDDRPFFFDFTKGAAARWRLLRPYALLALAALLAALAAGRAGPRARFGVVGRAALLAPLLGLSFMLAEIALLQRLTPAVGEPALMLSVTLLSLLLCCGLASAALGASGARPRQGALALLAAAACAAVTLRLRGGCGFYDRFGDAGRLAAVFFTIAPVAACLGLPFPTLLRREARQPGAAGYLWGLNGLGSVAGGALALIVSSTLGIPACGWAAAACYALASML